jgi:hypothetical protein
MSFCVLFTELAIVDDPSISFCGTLLYSTHAQNTEGIITK